VSGNNVMPASTRERLGRRVGNAGTEAGVWSPVVVVNHPRPQDEPKMPFIQHNQPIQTLASDRADQPFAERIRLRRAKRRAKNLDPTAPKYVVKTVGEFLVLVASQEAK